MRILDIKKQAARRLKKNLTKAVSLVILVMLVGFGVLLAEQAFVILLNTLTMSAKAQPNLLSINGTTKAVTISAMAMAFAVSAFVLSPLLLSIKKWYMKLRDFNPSLSEALGAFHNAKTYFRTVWYSFVKIIGLVGVFFCLLAPITAIAIVLKTQVNHSNQTLAILFEILFIAMVFLGIFAAGVAFYIALGFFYADYLFLDGMVSSPIRAIKLSFQLSYAHRSSLISAYFSVLPYMLLCIFIVPIVFVVPYATSTLAFFAKEQLGFLQNRKCICA